MKKTLFAFAFVSFSLSGATPSFHESIYFFPANQNNIILGSGPTTPEIKVFGEMTESSSRQREIPVSWITSKIKHFREGLQIQTLNWESGKVVSFKLEKKLPLLMYTSSESTPDEVGVRWNRYIIISSFTTEVDKKSDQPGGPFVDGFAYTGKSFELKSSKPIELKFSKVKKNDPRIKLVIQPGEFSSSCIEVDKNFVCRGDHPDNLLVGKIITPRNEIESFNYYKKPVYGEWIPGYRTIPVDDDRSGNDCASLLMFNSKEIFKVQLPCNSQW